MRNLRRLLCTLLPVALAASASAQWDPANGQWGKSNADDLRVMTWNVEDGICSSNDKVEGLGNWDALARIVAAMKPDVLILQEMGDNTGNGTGSGVDFPTNLLLTLDLFLYGGFDPFKSGSPPVTGYVQKYAPGYDLPHHFVSVNSDGFNRNVILSRYPFADLNGDGTSTFSDMPLLFSDAYNVSGSGGIRGYQIAEIDLPDTIYSGDLVIGNSHLKAGGSSSDKTQRLNAAKNIAYLIDYWLNGAGTGTPDPNGRVNDLPPVTSILTADTLVITGGDWNEDEITNGTKGPAEWIMNAVVSGGTSDGTDRDGSDMEYDDARDPFNMSNDNTLGSSKLDYLAWQDSIATKRRAFVFNSLTMPSSAWPPEIQGYPSTVVITSQAADHRPVILDLELPGGPQTKPSARTVNGKPSKTGFTLP